MLPLSPPAVPRIDGNDTYEYYSTMRREMTFVFRHLLTCQLALVDFGLGFALINAGGGEVRRRIERVAEWLQSLRPNKSDPVDILLTHGHYDHIYGVLLLAEFLPLRVFASAYTHYLLRQLGARDRRGEQTRINYEEVILSDLRGSFQVGARHNGAITVRYFPVVHMPQSRGYVLEFPRTDDSTQVDKVLFGSELRIAEPSYTPGLSAAMLNAVAELGPYDTILYDGLREHQPGFTPDESVIREPLRKILRKIPGHLIMSFISSKMALIHEIARVFAEEGHLLDARGGAMQRSHKIGLEAGWVPPTPRLPGKKQIVGLIVTGSQAEGKRIEGDQAEQGCSYLVRISETGKGDILPNDFIWIVQGAIPMYIVEIKAMYEALALLLPEGGIIIPRAEQRRLQLTSPLNNIYILEDFVGCEPMILPSAHDCHAGIQTFLAAGQQLGPARVLKAYQAGRDEDAYDAGEMLEPVLNLQPAQPGGLVDALEQLLATMPNAA